MQIPFTIEQFLDVFRDYNQSVFPIQFVFILLAILAVYLCFKPNTFSDKIIVMILSILWLWMGIVYHFIFFTTINKAAYLFGTMFVLQGIFLGITGVYKNYFAFHLKKDVFGITGMILILFALILYPMLGYLFGHKYPASPSFGLPCPTTIFTFGILLLSNRVPYLVLAVPFFWSVIGFMAALNLGIREDTGLLIAGLISFPMLIYRNKLVEKMNTGNQQ